MSWYYVANNEQKGPVDQSELEHLAATEQIPTDTLVWTEGMDNWTPLNELAQIDPLDQPPPPVPPILSQTQPAHSPSPVQPTAHSETSTSGPKGKHDFEFTIEGRPDYSFLNVEIPADQTLKVEASAMATMDSHLVMKTKLKGGFGRFLTGESIFINDFTAQGAPAKIGIAPGSPGDLEHTYLDENNPIVYLQSSAFVASGPNVLVESKWQGLVKGFFSGESLFLIKCSGQGDLWFNTYGAIFEVDVSGNYVVDTGFIVGFTEGLTYNVTKVGGYKSLFLSGEGFVCKFQGQGKVWIQTRQVFPFAWWVYPFRPAKNKN